MYSIKEIGDISGVTARTLRYYHKIGLLVPKIDDNKYRVYNDEDLNKLQLILFYKELEFPLKDIGVMLQNNQNNHTKILNQQYNLLKQKEERLKRVLNLLEETLDKGVESMSNKKKFEAFKAHKLKEHEEKYGREAREKYGQEAVEKSNSYFKEIPESQYQSAVETEEKLIELLDQLLETKGSLKNEKAKEAFLAHKKWLQLMSGQYSRLYHLAMADLYVTDERFKSYYNDKTKKDSVELLSQIIKTYA